MNQGLTSLDDPLSHLFFNPLAVITFFSPRVNCVVIADPAVPKLLSLAITVPQENMNMYFFSPASIQLELQKLFSCLLQTIEAKAVSLCSFGVQAFHSNLAGLGWLKRSVEYQGNGQVDLLRVLTAI